MFFPMRVLTYVGLWVGRFRELVDRKIRQGSRHVFIDIVQVKANGSDVEHPVRTNCSALMAPKTTVSKE